MLCLFLILDLLKKKNLITGLVPEYVENGIAILQYADDIIIFLDHDIDLAKNMKLLLCVFEQLSGPKINHHKSDIFCFG